MPRPSSSIPSRVRTGGQILVDQLVLHGVRHIFCVPGESYLAVLDALHDAPIELTVCRQEGGAAMMAEAHGKLTGQPGVCFVTRGPGATNAAAGVHIAMQDSTPMVLLVGQIERGARGREAFQEVDYRAAFGPLAKWATEVDDARRLPEIVARAFSLACSGRPGPVVVALPEDMLTERAEVSDARAPQPIASAPSSAQMAQLLERLAQARNPVAIVGGSRWEAQAVARFQDFAAAHALPVACSFRRQMLFDHQHPCYAGDLGLGVNPALLARIRAADLLLLVGGRLSEVPSQGYTLLDIPTPQIPLVHVYPDPDELGRVYQAQWPINASPAAFCAALPTTAAQAPSAQRQQAVHEAHAAYQAWSDPAPIHIPGNLQMGAVMQHLREVLPPDTVFCNGAGNFATWVHRFWPFRQFGTQLAPTSGSMGYGLPAGVGALRLWPERTVVVFAGDGDFLMHGQEFATAVQYRLPLLVVLLDNGMYGTIRMHQEREYPHRVSGTQLQNPDFAAYAKAFGGHGARVAHTEEFAPAFARLREAAAATRLPALVHCLIDPEAITPGRSLSQIRGK